MTAPGVLPILTYHAIDANRAVTSTDPARFAETLDALIGAGFRAVDLGEWVDSGRPAVDRGFAIAFDDGLRSILGVADRLARLRIPATVFLLSDRIGLDNAWPGQPAGIPKARLLGRSDLESLSRLGLRFGSHGRSHRRFDRLGSVELEDELVRSRDRIEQMLGSRCQLLAYPYGSADAQVRSATSRAYDAAFGTRLAYGSAADDPFDIARIDAYYLRSDRGPRTADRRPMARPARLPQGLEGGSGDSGFRGLLVVWVECNEPHQHFRVVGLVALDPPYIFTCRSSRPRRS